MRRVLVPLDGSDLAEAVLPDARRLTGPDGQLILMRDAGRVPFYGFYGPRYIDKQVSAVQAAREYVEDRAKSLRTDGVSVEAHVTVLDNAAEAIDEALELFQADMVAVATHGRNPGQRLVRGGIVWQALAHSRVPVLVRHADEADTRLEPRQRHLLVPLDGSGLAEIALPLAQELASEWQATTSLVRVLPDPFVASQGGLDMSTFAAQEKGSVKGEVQGYLQRIADRWQGEVHIQVLTGPVVDRLVVAVEELAVTDIIMASQGRTGLTRVLLGSVADALIHRLHLPIVVVPALAAKAAGRTQGEHREGAQPRFVS